MTLPACWGPSFGFASHHIAVYLGQTLSFETVLLITIFEGGPELAVGPNGFAIIKMSISSFNSSLICCS